MKTCGQCQIKYPDALEYCPADGSPLPAAAGRTQAMYDALIGSTVDGRYCIEAKLGEGGMGVVYAARHVIIDKRVAMKVLKAEAQEDPTAGQRFIQEAKSASKIRHANIVDITDFGMLADGSAYFVMEFLEGHTLGDVIRKGPMPALRVIHIAAQVARGLHAAHGKGIIHRDLKPENVFLLEREGVPDFVKIVDFGIAKMQEGGALGMAGQRLTQAGMVLGTPEYMSPEQATGKDSDHRVDEYALGCILYEMLTGDVPYRGETSAGTLTKHVFDPIVPPRKKRPDLNIPIALDAVVVKAMAKTADDRYPGMKELIEALEHASAEIETGRDAVKQANLVGEASRTTQVGPQIPADDVHAGSARASRLPMIFGVVGVVAILGGAGAYGLLGIGSKSDAASQPQTTQATLVAPPPVVPEPHKRPTRIELTLRSEPDGAEIWQGDTLVGQAPHKLDLPAGSSVEFTFRKAGYEDRAERVTPDKDQVLSVTLVAQAEQKPSSRKGSSARSSSLKLNLKPTRSAKNGTSVPQNDLRNPFQ